MSNRRGMIKKVRNTAKVRQGVEGDEIFLDVVFQGGRDDCMG